MRLHVPHAVAAQCGITAPATDLEARFSLPFAVALVLSATSTGPAGFSIEALARPDLRELAERVEIIGTGALPTFAARADVETPGGRRSAAADVSVPLSVDRIDEQQQRLAAKFAELAGPLLGPAAVQRLIAGVRAIAEAPDVYAITNLSSAR